MLASGDWRHREQQETAMASGFDHFSTDPDVQRRVHEAHAERARYAQELMGRGARSFRNSGWAGRGSLSIGAAALAFVALTSFAPWQPKVVGAAPTSSFSIAELTQQVRDLPTAEQLDTH
jgi:hypothetical protein